MSYFRELPNIKYPSFLSEKNSSLDYLEVKNFFRRVKLREDLQNTLTVFNKFEIPMGSRPDNVAEDLYGSASLDWVVITCAGIVNIRDEWPLNLPQGKRVNSDFTVKYYDNNLGTYVTKSGTDVRTGISHYVHETRINDNKRFIFVLKNEYLQQFLNDFRDIMVYGKSSQFINDKTVRTENLNLSMP